MLVQNFGVKRVGNTELLGAGVPQFFGGVGEGWATKILGSCGLHLRGQLFVLL